MGNFILLGMGFSGYFAIYMTISIRKKMNNDPFLSEHWKSYLKQKWRYAIYVLIFIISSILIFYSLFEIFMKK